MSRFKTICLITILALSCGLVDVLQAANKEIKPDTYQVNAVNWQLKEGSWLCRIKGDVKPAYTMYELFSPHRLIIDIAFGRLSEDINFPVKLVKGPITSIDGKVLTGQDPHVARLELFLATDQEYSVVSSGNDILVKFDDSSQKTLTVAEQSKPVINDVKITSAGNKTKIILVAGKAIQNYRSQELLKENSHPARLIVDLDDVVTKGHAVPAHEGAPVSLVRTENYKEGTRVIIDAASEELFRYAISQTDSGLLISVEPPVVDATPVIAEITGLPPAKVAQKKTVASPKEMPPAVTQKESTQAPSATITKSSSEDADLSDFSFAGYTEQKISVDFYKIDLHNVFRLIGEISGRNIVIAEGVGGSLTLALNDVPWDFVLDVILNLKDLAKEERFNTIVISQKSKGFSWPERAEDNLDIKKEAISVTKRLDVPKEKLESRKLIRQARNLEESGNYRGALALYEKAFESWADNGDLAKRITSIALVKLGLNTKAAHYGKIASRLLPENREVALQTALSLANMEMVKEATGYFEFAVSGERPSRQALASYAAFSEQNGSNNMALSLLGRYEEIYGTSLESMVSKARIYEKIGDTEKAATEYQTILLSGFKVPADLEKYIKKRLQQ